MNLMFSAKIKPTYGNTNSKIIYFYRKKISIMKWV